MTDTAPLPDAAFWLTSAAILLLVGVCALFAAAETALTAASRTRLHGHAGRRAWGAVSALAIATDSERTVGALLLGGNIAKILSVSLASALMLRHFGPSGLGFAILAMALLLLIFAEVLPRTVAMAHPEAVLLRVAPVIRPLLRLLSPVVAAVRAMVRLILHSIGASEAAEAKIAALREEIVGAITLGHSEGAVEKEDRDRLLGTLDLSRRTVEEVMRHRSLIEMIDLDRPASEVIDRALASPHTRLPLYRQNAENIVGILHAKDLLREVHRLRIEGADIATLDPLKVAMKPYFIPETTTLDEQMREFLSRRTHFALVVDEYGALRGLITLEDILEQIVGQITDEMDVVARDGGLKAAQQRGGSAVVADLPGCDKQVDRTALRIGNGVNFGVHTAFRAADQPSAPPFFTRRLEAVRCAFK